MAGKQAITVDTPVCTGCRVCEMICSLFHEGAVNPEKSLVRITDNYDQSLFEPHLCQLCQPPDCVNACPLNALQQDPATGLIKVDASLCDGCMACVEACPYDAIWWSDELERLFVCDRCGGDPQCVQVCYRQVLKLEAA